MTDKKAMTAARAVLDRYLERRGHRKTSERYTILEAIYAIDGHFTLEELSEKLEREQRFIVSRATLYNTLRLFTELRIVTRHSLGGTTSFEACLNHGEHSHLVCTRCGSVTEVDSPQVSQAIGLMPTGGFLPDGYTLYIYGLCGQCRAEGETAL
ncbi:MAG: transcriptional repressor [Prevotella sp.]|nr:transcriptional repressor [Prevotella sp.]